VTLELIVDIIAVLNVMIKIQSVPNMPKRENVGTNIKVTGCAKTVPHHAEHVPV
jgi:hypothetical protein